LLLPARESTLYLPANLADHVRMFIAAAWRRLANEMKFQHLAPTDNHASSPPLNFLQTGCPSCRPTNSVKALMGTCCEEISKKLFEHFYNYSASASLPTKSGPNSFSRTKERELETGPMA